MTIFHLIDDNTSIPAITLTTAGVSSSLLTLCYVGGLYISTRTRIGAARNQEGKYLDREDATVVKSRLKTVCYTTGLSLLGTGTLIRSTAFSHQPNVIANLSTLRVLGYPLPVPSFLHSSTLPFQPSLTSYTLHHVLPSIMSPLLLTSVLFLGPLYVAALDGTLPCQRNFSIKEDIVSKYDNVWGIRNFIIGPLTEEIIFRGCVLGLHNLAGIGRKKLILLTPLYFGIAHLHHAYESYVKEGRTREGLKRSLTVSGVQFAYTCIFGWYSNFLFLRTGNILSPLVAHIYCNVMGLPNPFEAAKRYDNRRGFIYTAHILGLVSFVTLLERLTLPGLSGGSWFWR